MITLIMGMLYKECKKCKGCIGIFGQFVGFIKCEICKKWIQKDKNPMFAKRKVRCSKCNFIVSFQAMGSIETRCIKCDNKMEQL